MSGFGNPIRETKGLINREIQWVINGEKGCQRNREIEAFEPFIASVNWPPTTLMSEVVLGSSVLEETPQIQEVGTEGEERPQKLAKMEENSSADSGAVHQLRDEEAASKAQTEAEKTVNAPKVELEGHRKGRTVFSFGYLGEGYQGLQVHVFTLRFS